MAAAFAAWSLEICGYYFGYLVAGGLRQLRQLPGRSEELMLLTTDRSELSVLTDDCKLWALPFIPCLMEERNMQLRL